MKINEIGRAYHFALRVFDKDGLKSDVAVKDITVPSFVSKLYFYKDPREGHSEYLIEAYYDNYPFYKYK